MDWLERIQKRFSEPMPWLEGIEELTASSFTPRACQVLALGRKEAERLHHNFLGTEHVLLGLIKLGQGVAVNVLVKLGLNLENVRAEVETVVGTGPEQAEIGNIPYTPRVKKVIALAQNEAKKLNHTYVGTEHLLLGLLREGDGVAAKVMRQLDVNLEAARTEILRELDPNFTPETQTLKPTVTGPAGIKNPQPGPANIRSDSVDTSKRYDVYCMERDHEIVVYRNALLKGVKTLFQTDQFDRSSQFIELEQANGQTMFLAKNSLIKFCEHGVASGAETISNETPE